MDGTAKYILYSAITINEINQFVHSNTFHLISTSSLISIGTYLPLYNKLSLNFISFVDFIPP